jgi:hypothetical protein
VSVHAFTGTQSQIITSAKVRAILGDEAADRVRERFGQQPADGDGDIEVDLGDDELAVIAALREISPDADDSSEQQATETLLKSLAGESPGPA